MNSTSKLFFKRPGECQPVLGSLFKQLITGCDNCDLRAKAVMYYNLFKSNPELAREIIAGTETASPIAILCTKGHCIEVFCEDEDNERKEKIVREFNTFSVIYEEPQEKFLKKELVQRIFQEEMESDSREAKRVKDTPAVAATATTPTAAPTPAPAPAPAPVPAATVQNLLVSLEMATH